MRSFLSLMAAVFIAIAAGIAVESQTGSTSPKVYTTAAESTGMASNTGAGSSGSSASNTGTASSSSTASVGYDGPAICAPTTDAATSGGSPDALEANTAEVASGTIEGEPWSLWSVNGQTGAEALEDGGLVFNGREYGMCPGYPNPSETEMIDTGGNGVMYGVVNYPGLAKVQISTGNINSFAVGNVLPSPAVQVVNGVSFYIDELPQSVCSYSYFEVNSTSTSYSAEHNIGFGGVGVGQGYNITNNPGNDGSCVAGQLDPLSYSEGVWQLPPGQFSIPLRPTTNSADAITRANLPGDDSNCSPTTDAASSGDSPTSLEASATEVANGTVNGESWSLWSANGETGATALEDGGLIVNGFAYGLCPGFPNPAEMEMINTGANAIVYGVIGYPGLAKVDLSVGTVGSFAPGVALPSPSVQVVNSVSFFIGSLPLSACSYSALELDATSASSSAQHNLGFAGTNPGSAENCTENQIDPISSSQGAW